MRKLFLLLIIAAVLLYFGKKDLAEFADDFDGEYIAYTTEVTPKVAFTVGGVNVYEASINLLNSNDIQGETISMTGKREDIDAVLKKLFSLYHYSEEIEDIYIVYGYSPKLRRTEFIDGRPVNFQITERNGVITISNPVNFGEY